MYILCIVQVRKYDVYSMPFFQSLRKCLSTMEMSNFTPTTTNVSQAQKKGVQRLYLPRSMDRDDTTTQTFMTLRTSKLARETNPRSRIVNTYILASVTFTLFV